MTPEERDQPKKGRLFINGRILTMDKNSSIAEALLIRNGLIEEVGGYEKIKQSASDNDIIVDLQGKTLLPGFIDAHSHFPFSGYSALGVNLNSPPIGKTTSIGQIIEALKRKAADLENERWLYGFGYDDTLLEEKRHPDRYELDEACGDRPVFITHVSGHLGVTNSAGLKLGGISSETPDPKRGGIRRDAETGEPTGVLEEAAQFPMRTMAMNFSAKERALMMETAVDDYTRAGVTTAQNGFTNLPLFNELSLASKTGLVPLRLVVWPDPLAAEKILKGEFETGSHNTEMFQIGATKIIGDGSIQGYTAYLTRPYHVPFNGDSAYRGYPVTDRPHMVSLVRKYHRAGMQVAIHGNGDATIDDIIYSISEAQKDFPRDDARHIIVHCQTVRDDQLDEIKRLGITPSFFSAHTYYWGDRHRNIFLGSDRAKRISPTRTAAEKGIRFSVHVDTPVTPMNPLLLVWSTVNRISTGGNIIGETERISPEEALRAVTIDAAWQIFQEENRGSLEKGKAADLVILSKDPLKNLETISNIEVVETIVGGNTVFKK